MKKSLEKKNKFKLVKYKRKLVPVAFGTVLVSTSAVLPIVSPLTKDEANSSINLKDLFESNLKYEKTIEKQSIQSENPSEPKIIIEPPLKERVEHAGYSEADALRDGWGFSFETSEIDDKLDRHDKKLYNSEFISHRRGAYFKGEIIGLILEKIDKRIWETRKIRLWGNHRNIYNKIRAKLENTKDLIELSMGNTPGKLPWDTGKVKVTINWGKIWSGRSPSVRYIENFMTDSRKVREWMASISGKEVKANLSDAAKRKSPNKITTNEIYDAIKKLPSYKRLTGTQKPRFSASNIRISKATTEEMEVQLHGRGTTLNTFKITSDVQAVINWLNSLTTRMLQNALPDSIKNKIPPQTSLKEISDFIHTLDSFNDLTPSQKAIVGKDVFIKLVYNENGRLDIMFRFQDKITSIDVQVKSVGNAANDLVKKIVKEITKEKIGEIDFKRNQLASAQENTSRDIKDAIISKIKETIKTIVGPHKLVKDKATSWTNLSNLPITFTHDDTKGELKVKIDPSRIFYGNPRTITISGFLTDKKVVENWVQSLDNDKIKRELDPEFLNRFMWGISDSDIFSELKKMKSFKALSPNQQKLFLSSNFESYRKGVAGGNWNFKIKNYGEVKEIEFNFLDSSAVLKAWILDAIKTLESEKEFNDIFNKAKQPDENNSDDIKDKIKVLITKIVGKLAKDEQTKVNGDQWIYEDLMNRLKHFISGLIINFDSNNKDGELVVKFDVKTKLDTSSTKQTFDITLSGFLTDKQVLANWVKSFDGDKVQEKLTSETKNKVSSDVTKSEVLAAIKKLASFQELDSDVKKLLLEANILLKTSDDGKIEVAINGHGAKTFNIEVKSNAVAAKEVAIKAIESVTTDHFKNIFNKNKQASDDANVSEDVKKEITDEVKKLVEHASQEVVAAAKALIVETLVSLTSNNTTGTLKIEFDLKTLDKTTKHSVDATGFLTDKQVLANWVKNFDGNKVQEKLTSETKNKVAVDVTKTEVLAAIKKLASFQELDSDVKKLLLEANILLKTSDDGKIEVAINGHGAKTFNIEVKSNAVAAKEVAIKAIESVTTDHFKNIFNKNKQASDDANVSEDVKKEITDEVKKLVEHASPEVVDAAKALIVETLVSLTSNNTTGTLKIEFDLKTLDKTTKHSVDATGFLTNEQVLTTWVKNFDGDKVQEKLTSGTKNKVSSDVTKAEVLAAIKKLDSFQELDSDVKKLLIEANISLKTSDDGKIEVTINGHGTRTFNIQVKPNAVAAKKLALDTIKSTDVDKIKQLFKQEIQASDSQNNSAEVKNNIVKAIQDLVSSTNNKVQEAAKKLITPALISFSHDNVTGKLTVTFDLSSLKDQETHTIEVSNFLTDKQAVTNWVQSLSSLKVQPEIAETPIAEKLGVKVTVEGIFEMLKGLESFGQLSKDQKKLLISNNIKKAWIGDNDVKVRILGHGEEKSFNIKVKTREAKAIEIILKIVKELTEEKLKEVTFDKEKKASNPDNKKESVKQEIIGVINDLIEKVDTTFNVKSIAKKHVSDSLSISLSHDDETGILSAILDTKAIKPDSQPKTIEFSDFLTNDEQALKNWINSLNDKIVNDEIGDNFKDMWATDVRRDLKPIFDALKKMDSFTKNLTEAQQKLFQISALNSTGTNTGGGERTFVIEYRGLEKEIKIKNMMSILKASKNFILKAIKTLEQSEDLKSIFKIDKQASDDENKTVALQRKIKELIQKIALKIAKDEYHKVARSPEKWVFKDITNKIKNEELKISFDNDDAKGELTIKVNIKERLDPSSEKQTFDITVSGFLTDEQVLQEWIRGLDDSDLKNNLTDEMKDKTSGTITREEVHELLIKLDSFLALEERQRRLLILEDVSLFDRGGGLFSALIENHGSTKRLEGKVKSSSLWALEIIEDLMKNLTKEKLGAIPFKYTKESSDPENKTKELKDAIKEAIKTLIITGSDNDKFEAKKIIDEDVSISFRENDIDGEITVIIDYTDVDPRTITSSKKSIIFSGFFSKHVEAKKLLLKVIKEISKDKLDEIEFKKDQQASDVPTATQGNVLLKIDEKIEGTDGISQEIKDLAKDLNNTSKVVVTFTHNNETGELNININPTKIDEDEPTKVVTISGFLTDKQAVENWIKSLDESKLQNALPDNIKGNIPHKTGQKAVFDFILTLDSFDQLTSDQKALVTQAVVKQINWFKDGTLKIEFEFEDASKIINLKVKSLKEAADELIIKVVKEISKDKLDEIEFKKDKQASAQENISDTIKNAIILKIEEVIDALVGPHQEIKNTAKRFINTNNLLITFTQNNETGELKININPYKFDKDEPIKVVAINGFLTDKQVLANWVKNFDGNKVQEKLTSETKNKVSSDVTKFEVLAAIQELDSFQELDSDVKKLLLEANISLKASDDGKIEVTINGHGAKTFNIEVKSNAVAAKEVALGTIKSTNVDNIKQFFKQEIQASDSQNNSPEVKNNIVKAIQDLVTFTNNKVKEDAKKWITPALISFSHDNVTGKLTVSFDLSSLKDQETHAVEVTGFLTNEQVLANWVQNFDGNKVQEKLTSETKNKVAADVTKAEVLAAIKKLDSFQELASDVKRLLLEANISLKASEEGKIEVTISEHGAKTFNIEVKSNAVAAKEVAIKAIESVTTDHFKNIFNKNKQASDDANVSEDVKKEITDEVKKLVEHASPEVVAAAKALIVETLVSLTSNNTTGTLKIEFDLKTLDKTTKHSVDATGFLTDKQVLANWVQNFDGNKVQEKLTSETKNKVAVDVTKTEVLAAIQKLDSFQELDSDVKKLLLEANISLKTSADGKIEVTISEHGTKTFNIQVKSNSVAATEVALDTIKSTDVDNIKQLFKQEIQASDSQNNSAEVKNNIVKAIQDLVTSTNNKVKEDAKKLITPALISFSHDNVIGKLTVTFDLSSLKDQETHTIEVSNFLTDKQAVENWIKSLDESKLQNALPDNIKGNIPHKTGQKAVFDFILTLDSFDQLTSDQKALVTQAVVKQINWLKDGTLKIEFEFEDASKIINLKVKSLKEAADELILKVVKEITKEKLGEIKFKKDKQASAQENISDTIKDAIILKIEELIDALVGPHQEIKDTAKSLTNTSNLLITFTQNNEIGELNININPTKIDEDEPTKVVAINGFLTNKQVLTAWVKNFDGNKVQEKLTSETKNKVAADVTKAEVLAAIKKLASFQELDSDVKKLLLEANISLKTSADGKIEVTISEHGTKTFNIEVKSNAVAAKEVAIKAIESVTTDNLKNLFNENKQASDDANVSEEVKKEITDEVKKLVGHSSPEIVAAAKALIVETLVSLTPNNTTGTLKIEFDLKTLDKNTKHSVDATDFLTDIQVVTNWVQSLSKGIVQKALPDEIKNNISSDASSVDMFEILTSLESFEDLHGSQKVLFEKGHISIATTQEGVISIIIVSHGKKKEIDVNVKSHADAAKELALKTIKELNAKNLEGAFDKKIQASDDKNNNEIVLKAIEKSVQEAIIHDNNIIKILAKKFINDKLISLIFDDEKGELTVVFDLKAWNENTPVQVDVSGFINNQKLVSEITSKEIGLPSSDKEKLASTVKKPENGTTDKGIKIDFPKWNPDNVTGEISWEAEVSKGKSIKTLNGKIEGLLTNKGALVKWVKALKDSHVQKVLSDKIKEKISADVKAEEVLKILKSVESFTKLDAEIRKLLLIENIELEPHPDGTVDVIIKNHGEDKRVTIQVKSNIEVVNKLVAESIKKAVESTIKEIFIKETQASRSRNQNDEIKGNIVTKLKDLVKTENKAIKILADSLITKDLISFISNDVDGQLSVSISLEKFEKDANNHTIVVYDFKTNKDLTDEWVQDLTAEAIEEKLSSEQKNSIADLTNIPVAEMFELITKLDSFSDLTDEQKQLFLQENIKLSQPENGKLVITISNYGEEKIIEIKVELLEEKAKAWALKVINELNADNLNEIFNQTVQSSDVQNLADDKKESIVEKIKELMNSDQQEEDVVKAAKELITKDLITLHPEDVEGVMSIDIDVKGLGGDETNKTLEITGFVTNNTIFKNFVNNLIDSDFENLLSDDEKNKPANEFTEQDILGKITKMDPYGLLKPQHQELLTAEKIGIKESGKENILEFSISNNGEEIKTFEVKLNKQINQTEEPIISSPIVEKEIENIEVDKEEKGDSGLSTTAIILIVVGSLLSIGLAGGLTYFIKKKKR